ncbi:hypothetical protein J1N35_008000 [Gossypium stocksii]|uniref:Aminotransferase-like plant mobile domain-containing protein n=1 Tax=Gossypium stocksii TaxID=47602 RepID=A0A9D3W806_9ROSI|nr:hypothetical protein J1N35_008000 [Gossypium stocksii]
MGGCLSILQSWALSIFTSSSGPLIYISTHNEVEPFSELCRNTYLFRRYTASIRPMIRSTIIPDEYFQNPNAWHVKVPLVSYATVEMHQSDRVLRQFGFQQLIPVAPEVFDDEHKVDLRQLHTNWPIFWSHYIKMWENRYDYILTQEPIIVPKPSSHEGLHKASSESSSFYQSPSSYGVQTPPPWVIQTPPQSLFYQDPLREEPQPPPEAEPRRNPALTCRRPPCGTDSDRHGH